MMKIFFLAIILLFIFLAACVPSPYQDTHKVERGAISDILEEGSSKTYTIGGIDYEVTLDFVGFSTIKFTVNGETTPTLTEGDSFTLSDGKRITVFDILTEEFPQGIRRVEFMLGNM